MNADEWQVLELAGAFLFVISFVPKVWYESQPQPIELARSEDQVVLQSWWQHHEPNISVASYFDERLTRADNWPYENDLKETSWTDKNFHRIELWESDEDGVTHLHSYIDARFDYADFLTKIVKFAVKADCLLFIDNEEGFVEPSKATGCPKLRRQSLSL